MFGIQLSGLSASQKYLDVTSNNISNTNTYGFKRSRAEFSDMYGNSVFSNKKTNVGLGVTTAVVAQQFAQGSLSGDTGNNLDMAINGNGFFVLSPTLNTADNLTEIGTRTYTRAGAFEFNKEGYIVTAQGDYLQVYNVNDDGTVSNLDIASTHALQVPSTTGAPKATTEVSIGVNLPANASALNQDSDGNEIYTDTTGGSTGTVPIVASAVNGFDTSDTSTYTGSTSQTIHDSLGGTHTLTYYFLKDSTVTDVDDANYGQTTWYMLAYVDGNPCDITNVVNTEENSDEEGVQLGVTDSNSACYGEVYRGAKLVFGSNGALQSQVPSAFHLANVIDGGAKYEIDDDDTDSYGSRDNTYSLAVCMGGGVAENQDIAISMNLTQYGSSSFSISESPTNDGYSTGLLNDVEVSEDGLIVATYTNGKQNYLGMVALADFVNPQGLTKIGDTQWKASINSGEPEARQANLGTAGSIKGSNLEMSNVDMAGSLVDLIVAQRSYQANAQAMQTQNTMLDAIMNVR
ncbi:MAG: flagellar hook protein FlgE [Succinivibrio sp.]|nr:flagellar hook protein FlgE [Succinivibrio sp.]